MTSKQKKWILVSSIILIGHLIGALCAWCFFSNPSNTTQQPTKNPEDVLIQRIRDASPIEVALPLVDQLYNHGKCSSKALKVAREIWLVGARQQNVSAQLRLADSYVKENGDETLFWWRIAALNYMNADAQFALGCAILREYNGIKYNKERVLHFLNLAASQGHPAAALTLIEIESKKKLPKIDNPLSANDFFMLGLYAAAGHERKISLSDAEKYWKVAIEKGHHRAALFLGASCLKQEKYEQAIFNFNIANQETSAEIKTLLAHTYINSITTPEAIEKGKSLLLEAAESGYPPAHYLLGKYTLDNVFQANIMPSAHFRKAIEGQNDQQPFPLASYAFGYCCYYGVGGESQSYEKAFPWIRSAANLNIISAQWLLSKMYREGLGTAVNLELADKWEARAHKANSLIHED